MSFDLNGKDFKEATIFNNGVAGKVENVSISVEKKKADDPDNAPDYKVFFSDEFGTINTGIYYPSDDATEQQMKITVGRALSIAKAVMGDNYVFPEVSSAKEAIDTCFKLVHKNQEGAKVNIFATYGTKSKPKTYIGVYKTFNFIEKAGKSPSTLRITNNPNKPDYNDLMERIQADPVENTQAEVSSTVTSDSDWLND